MKMIMNLFFFLFLHSFYFTQVTSQSQKKTPFELFQDYQLSVENWVEGKGNSKKSLTDAMNSISEFIPWLLSQQRLPPGLDPLVIII